MEICGRDGDRGTRCDPLRNNKDDDDNTRVYSNAFLFLCMLNVNIDILKL